MNDVAEFIRIREQIEANAKKISILLEQSEMAESKLMLDQADGLLAQLATMVDNDIQITAVGRLTRLLTSLRTKVASMEKKKRPVKKISLRDGLRLS